MRGYERRVISGGHYTSKTVPLSIQFVFLRGGKRSTLMVELHPHFKHFVSVLGHEPSIDKDLLVP